MLMLLDEIFNFAAMGFVMDKTLELAGETPRKKPAPVAPSP